MNEPTELQRVAPTRRLEGKRALITGAASGIGRATALRFAEEGANLALWDVNEEQLAAVVGEVTRLGTSVMSSVTNVAEEDEVANAAEAITQAWAGLDVVVANAAVSFPADVPVHELDIEIWDRVFSVNLTGMFLTYKNGVRSIMAHDGGGSIICVSSGAAFKPAVGSE
ncbi:MAG TPA: SDR family NAD(P)-dependent oxidoreductase [Actinobacteria bacterium]|nr:SDR family NAD(P)-dependent oxidoreductase [Actinomycetota bacterium]